MTEDDFELVRRAWAAFSRVDETAIVETLHPEVVAVPFGAAMETKAYRGREEVLGGGGRRSEPTGSRSRCSLRTSSAWETSSLSQVAGTPAARRAG